MSKTNPYANLTKNLKAKTDKTKSENLIKVQEGDGKNIEQEESLSMESIKTKESQSVVPKKKGRPSTGKRSNPDWIGRTYYIRKEIDLDVADQLLKLKREGIDLDKSDLVNFLLEEWVKSQQGENATFRIGENM
ncbi:hypothetical protein IQ215_13240 [Cyanobacterium stanieri LEGE 03274]|uniref:Uncharacterized protein n=1 Tax=Cyanobacterium stanieri LEGE 03274 TaxID=1828756 RepID=A0ABR9V6X0_9CHRO|nr:hypothetical protein [Cyanobacterium stanieri]MBE9223662.1 hypothetical protein [Cyanobacterium stanieri LEGE 03274]